MRLLLDTHTLLWFAEGDPNLSETAVRAIQDAANEPFVSIASYWELAIKSSLHRYEFDHSPAVLQAAAATAGIGLMPLTIEHVERVRRLPLLHRDPFDRILIAQAAVSESTLVTKDGQFGDYGVATLW